MASSPLVPRNDPTLMFVNSGMVQFKNLFTGVETAGLQARHNGPEMRARRVASTMISTMSATPMRHHTFFEMLGNFSFGDYFKQDAIPFAWDMVTKDLGIAKDKLVADGLSHR